VLRCHWFLWEIAEPALAMRENPRWNGIARRRHGDEIALPFRTAHYLLNNA
jgi:hypothetical protein